MAFGNADQPLFVISVAAELAEMHPQTLRLYERKQLIRPGRSSGKTRLYSERDIEHLREIRRLTQELGVNLAGVEEIMRLRHELDGAKSHLESNVRRIQQDITERDVEFAGVDVQVRTLTEDERSARASAASRSGKARVAVTGGMGAVRKLISVSAPRVPRLPAISLTRS